MIPLNPLPNLIDQVYARILEAITDRTLLPGQRIRQNELAERLEEPDFANVVIETLRPVSDLPLSSHLIELSERVAAADEDVHPHEVQAIKLLRLLTLVLPRSKPVPPAAARADNDGSFGA